MTRSAALVLLALALAGCDGSGTDPVGEGVEGRTPASLAEARAAWEAGGVSAYRIVFVRHCECSHAVAGPWTVEVRGGQVVAATSEGGAGQRVEPRTVAGFFRVLDEAFAADTVAVRFRYDPATGLPLSLLVDYAAEVADDELSVQVLGFRALP
ncbi:DUF6174 domain-containing protein [Rubrivirga sp. S365]|uniref:DUF6174 domain-containing protein n=1 Tax=Rubrivirga litoralis TaxID=3075598 RepID=A0ABU3BP23_9BACT|nr:MULTISPECIES: DUF6174 domain-containing protein [unclassified Rubrivirga]MDT0631046.1 DUF6174 domain-containing protein [Rubrivirga sp. F394]MDT7855072.1 DUF6174 domain-containing protein [Rubrivirga sp. S365]